MNIIFQYIVTLVPILVLDALWILVVARSFYADQMGNIFSKTVNMTPVYIFYPVYALAVLLLAVIPALSSSLWIEALWRGALLGLAAYGAYDLTNHATLDGWSALMTLVDMAWGIIMTAVVSMIAYFIIVTLK